MAHTIPLAVPARRRFAVWGRIRAALPTGSSLPDAEFRRRHRALLALLWAQVVLIAVYAAAQGAPAFQVFKDVALIIASAAGATWIFTDRRRAPALVAFGLMTSSVVFVYLSDGLDVAHFHIFVMIAALSLYEEWVPFLLATVYVLVHHGVLGAVDPSAVYSNGEAADHPWRWAAIHAAFVGAAGIMAIIAWRLNEDVREKEKLAVQRAQVAEAEATRVAEELARSNRELEQYAYVASHDLTEPLRTVSGFIELLDRRYADSLDDTAREFISHAVGGTKRMQQLIDDLLEYSRVGQTDFSARRVSLDDITLTVLDDLHERIEQTGAQIAVGELPVVLGEEGQLRQLLQNLVANAIKFVESSPPLVHVSAMRDGDDWTISVADNGIGVDPAQQERIFQMFQRLHGRDAYEGTGIGLPICQRIVDRHGGRIWVEPGSSGGSVFRFSVPAA